MRPTFPGSVAARQGIPCGRPAVRDAAGQRRPGSARQTAFRPTAVNAARTWAICVSSGGVTSPQG